MSAVRQPDTSPSHGINFVFVSQHSTLASAEIRIITVRDAYYAFQAITSTLSNTAYTPHYWFPPHSDIQAAPRTDQTLHIQKGELGCQPRPSQGLQQQ